MSFPTTAIIAIILASFLGTVHSILHNVTKLGGNQEVNFPLQSGEINSRMVIVDSRQVCGDSRLNPFDLTFSTNTAVNG